MVLRRVQGGVSVDFFEPLHSIVIGKGIVIILIVVIILVDLVIFVVVPIDLMIVDTNNILVLV